MNELINMLTSNLDVTENQAQGGAGLLFKMAQSKLGGDFSQVTEVLPGVLDLIAKAPATDSGSATSGGLMGMAGTAMSALGVGKTGGLADLAKMAGSIESLGLDMNTVMKFAPIILKFAESKGGSDLTNLLKKVMG